MSGSSAPSHERMMIAMAARVANDDETAHVKWIGKLLQLLARRINRRIDHALPNRRLQDVLIVLAGFDGEVGATVLENPVNPLRARFPMRHMQHRGQDRKSVV